MNNLTGGIIPAMTWQMMMMQAHQTIDLKPIPGISNPFPNRRLQLILNWWRRTHDNGDKPQNTVPDYPRSSKPPVS